MTSCDVLAVGAGGRGKNFSKKSAEEEDDEGEQFVKRRLSVAAPFGGEDMDA